jgi:queuosine precursor transporter
MLNLILNYKSTLSYIGLIVIINSLFTYVPTIDIAGQAVSPADMTVGFIYILRDFSQREIKSYVLLAMLVGGLLSYIFAQNTVAFASLCAFFVGELIDWILFTWTKKPLSRRLLISSFCSCPIDTIVFLALISRLNWLEFTMMTLFKFSGVFTVWWYWQRRQKQRLPSAYA